MRIAAALVLCLPVLSVFPTAAPARILDGPPVLNTNGRHDLDPWETKTDAWLNPAVNYGLYEFSHYHSGGSSVTASSSNQEEWESVTYTNWSTSTDHYAQTWAYWWAPSPDADGPHDWSPNPLPELALAFVSPRPSIDEATIDLTAKRAAAVTARCPIGMRLAHAEGEVLWLSRNATANAPEPVVTETLTSATARVAAGAVTRKDGRLKILIHCGGASEALYGSGVRIGSWTNDESRLGDGGEVAYAGRGHDHVVAGAGEDVVYGEGGDDMLEGGGGQDVLDGGRGNDILRSSGAGTRTLLRGGPGRDMLIGGRGVDYIDARDGSGADTIRCGAGRDIVRADPGDLVAGDCDVVLRSRE